MNLTMEDTRLDRCLRTGFFALVGLVLVTMLTLQSVQGLDASADWEFWTTGRTHPIETKPNALHSPIYAVVVGCLGCWGILAMVLGRLRAGVVTLLFAAVALNLYFPANRAPHWWPLGVLGMTVFLVADWVLKPWRIVRKSNRVDTQV